MFDFDASKLLIIGVVALIVIGPKDLPRVLRQVGQAVGKLRRMAAEFQGQFMDAMKEADLADLKREVGKLKDSASLDVHFDPVRDVKDQLSNVIGPPSNSAGSVASIAPPPSSADGPMPAPAPAEPAIVGAAGISDPIYLEPAAPAHHTPASAAGAVHAVEADLGEAARKRRVVVAKRRPPAAPGPVRGRTLLPPRRDPRP